MHVVFLSPHCDPQADLGEPDSGGQCVYEHELASALARRGIYVTVFCRDTGRRETHTSVHHFYQIHRIPCGPQGFIRKEDIWAVLPEFATKVVTFLANNPPDIIHGHYWDGGKASLHLMRLLPPTIPLVWTPHSLGTLKRRKFEGKELEFTYNFIPRIAFESYTLFACSKIIVSSEKEKKAAIDDYSVEAKTLCVVPPGVDFSRLQKIDKRKAREKLHLPVDGKVLLCVGRITPSKNYEHAISALATTKEKYEHPIYLAIVGGSGTQMSEEEKDYKEFLVQHSKNLGVEKEVLFLPALPYDDVATAYSSADIHLTVAQQEPYGLTVIESMVMGVPVIAANTGGAASIITHNVTGSLVDVTQPGRVASYILSYMKDDDLYERVQSQAESFARDTYGWDQVAQNFITTYEEAKRVEMRPHFQEWVGHNHFLLHNLQM